MVLSGSNGEPEGKENNEMATNGNGGNGGNGNTTPAKKTAAKKAAKQKLSPEAELRVRREALGISRARLADAADVAVSAVWRAEHEDAGVDIETRERIVGVLNQHRASIANMPPL